jgi:hypothetical protein
MGNHTRGNQQRLNGPQEKMTKCLPSTRTLGMSYEMPTQTVETSWRFTEHKISDQTMIYKTKAKAIAIIYKIK